jgi:hypothetical protein
MGIGAGLIALTLFGAEGPTAPAMPGQPAVEPVAFQVRVLTFDGLDWRTQAYSRLKPVARPGLATVWTAEKGVSEMLTGMATSSSSAIACSTPGGSAVSQRSDVHYVAHLQRCANGPVDHATQVAFVPEIGRLSESFQAMVTGRKIDQGFLAHVRLEDDHIQTIHVVPLKEKIARASGTGTPRKTAFTGASMGMKALGAVIQAVAQDDDGDDDHESNALVAQVQVPEVSSTHVEGEWLIPSDGMLLISLGVATCADRDGKAVVRERVAVIETAAPEASEPPSPFAEPLKVGFASVPDTQPQPPMPSRTLPQPVDADGKLVELPPLPEAYASTDLDRIKPDPNQPSPQMVANGSVDTEVARTGLDVAAPAHPLMPATKPAECTHSAATQALAALFERIGVELETDAKACPADASKPPKAMDRSSGSPVSADLIAFCADLSELMSRHGVTHEMMARGRAPMACCTEDDDEEDDDDECDCCDEADGDAKVKQASVEMPREMIIERRIETEMPHEVQIGRKVVKLDGPATKALGARLDHLKAGFGFSVKDASGMCVLDMDADMTGAFKNPGQSETLRIPLGGKLMLEVKATVVPSAAPPAMAPAAPSPEKATKEIGAFW